MNTPIKCDFKPGQIIDSRYRVDQILGEGAFGKVFRVKNEKEETFALKLLKLWEVDQEICEGLQERFVMEFETGRIASNYLVQAYEYGETYGNPYIVMEYCPNGDLSKYTNRSDMQRVASEILFGLKDLHSHGKVHRDLKPENVLFNKSWRAVLTDFGIAGDQNKRLTERNILGRPLQIFGTFAYMPPEQVNRARGNATVLPTTDIFSFGVMMYQVFTGELPFGPLNNYNDLAIYQRNAKEGIWDTAKLKRSVSVNSVWVKMITNCLKPDYKQRLSSVDAILSYFPQTVLNEKEAMIAPKISSYSSIGLAKGMALRITHGINYGNVYYLRSLVNKKQYIITVGRETDNVLCLPETSTSYISRHHCTIEANPDYSKWYIRDGQWQSGDKTWHRSLNGTYLNSKEVSLDGMALSAGDIISIGDIKIKVE